MVVSRLTPFLGFLKDLEALPPLEAEGLQAFGLRGAPRRPAIHYRTFDEALRAGTVSVKELHALGATSLVLMNTGKWLVFLPKGERLSGGRGEWTLGKSILLGPMETLKAPARPAAPGPAPSPAGAPRLHAPGDSTGALFARAGSVTGLVLFGRKDLLRRAWPREIESRSGTSPAEPRPPLGQEDAAAWLLAASGAAVEIVPSPGLGLSVSIRGEGFEGEALLLESEPVHVILDAKR